MVNRILSSQGKFKLVIVGSKISLRGLITIEYCTTEFMIADEKKSKGCGGILCSRGFHFIEKRNVFFFMQILLFTFSPFKKDNHLMQTFVMKTLIIRE